MSGLESLSPKGNITCKKLPVRREIKASRQSETLLGVLQEGLGVQRSLD